MAQYVSAAGSTVAAIGALQQGQQNRTQLLAQAQANNYNAIVNRARAETTRQLTARKVSILGAVYEGRAQTVEKSYEQKASITEQVYGQQATIAETEYGRKADVVEQVYGQKADAVLDAYGQQEEMVRRQSRVAAGDRRARIAESGTGFGGSNAAAEYQAEMFSELDALNVRYEGQMQSHDLRQSGYLEAQDLRRAGYLEAFNLRRSGALEAYDLRKSGYLEAFDLRQTGALQMDETSIAGEQEARDYETQAGLDDYAAANNTQSSNFAVRNSYLGFAGKVLGGTGDYIRLSGSNYDAPRTRSYDFTPNSAGGYGRVG
jgi:hypothetical protein